MHQEDAVFVKMRHPFLFDLCVRSPLEVSYIFVQTDKRYTCNLVVEVWYNLLVTSIEQNNG